MCKDLEISRIRHYLPYHLPHKIVLFTTPFVNGGSPVAVIFAEVKFIILFIFTLRFIYHYCNKFSRSQTIV
ncbi:hypothetical protein TNCV_1737821 [Trichonephila clavipes]|nr:hypothetical protein TNCV_1737821 [Trichonephila clavipes]